MIERSTVIEAVETEAQEAALWTLLGEFQEWLAETVPHEYDPDAGLAKDRRDFAGQSDFWAWVARADGTAAGCVLLYGVTADLAEFGRLWVRPAHRSRGLGRRLTRTVVDEARARGYECLGLTTPPWSEAAHSIYESLGFERVPPYPETRLPEPYHEHAIFMQRDL